MTYVYSFLVGGLLCVFAQILIDKTKITPAYILVGYVCAGVVLSAVGLYEPFKEFAAAGATVPLLGFGNVLWNGVREAVDAEGFMGIFMGGFKASAVGISGALILSYLASLVFDPKMK